jgi:hypothetical protein
MVRVVERGSAASGTNAVLEVADDTNDDDDDTVAAAKGRAAVAPMKFQEAKARRELLL